MRVLATKKHVIAIIGPLLSSTTEAAAQEAEEPKVALITLSPLQGIAYRGEYIFQNSLTYASQVKTLVAYAFKEKGKIFCRQQAGAAIQNFLLKIQETGLSTCWIGYFVEDQIKRELKIPEDIQIEAVFPIGYEFEKQKTRKVRIDIDRILYFNKYKNKKMKKPRKLEV